MEARYLVSRLLIGIDCCPEGGMRGSAGRGGWYAAGEGLSSADRGSLICRDGESASQLQVRSVCVQVSYIALASFSHRPPAAPPRLPICAASAGRC